MTVDGQSLEVTSLSFEVPVNSPSDEQMVKANVLITQDFSGKCKSIKVGFLCLLSDSVRLSCRFRFSGIGRESRTMSYYTHSSGYSCRGELMDFLVETQLIFL